jgi:hypothetical protein
VIDLLVATETLLLCLLGLLVLGLLRSHAEILRRLETGAGASAIPPPAARIAGRPARDVAGLTPSGDARSYALHPGSPDTLLAFLSSGCSSCANLLEGLRRNLEVASTTRLIVVAKDPAEEHAARFEPVAANAHVVMSSRAWADYAVPGSPYFAYVDGRTGTVVGEGSAPTWERVQSLLADALEDASTVRGDSPSRITEELRAAGVDADDPTLYPSRA